MSGSHGTLSNGSCSGGGVNATGGVTFYLVAQGSTNNGTVAISTCFAITAPTPSQATTMSSGSATLGQTQGIAIWVDNGMSTSGQDGVTGGGSVAIQGAIYDPSRLVKYTGSATATASCTQLVANTINFTGTANFQHNCSGTGVSDALTSSKIKLSE